MTPAVARARVPVGGWYRRVDCSDLAPEALTRLMLDAMGTGPRLPAGFNWDAVPVAVWDILERSAVFARAQRADGPLGLGEPVRTSLTGGRSRAAMTHEGVVCDVCPVGCPVDWRRLRLDRPQVLVSRRPRYVVQLWDCRVVRLAVELIVVALERGAAAPAGGAWS